MEYLVSGVWVGIELLCSIFFSGAFLLRRDNSRKQVVLVIVTWLIMGLYTNLGIEQIVKQILTVIFFTWVTAVLYKGNGFLYFILALICYIFIAAIDAIVVNCMCGLLHISRKQIRHSVNGEVDML